MACLQKGRPVKEHENRAKFFRSDFTELSTPKCPNLRGQKEGAVARTVLLQKTAHQIIHSGREPELLIISHSARKESGAH